MRCSDEVKPGIYRVKIPADLGNLTSLRTNTTTGTEIFLKKGGEFTVLGRVSCASQNHVDVSNTCCSTCKGRFRTFEGDVCLSWSGELALEEISEINLDRIVKIKNNFRMIRLD